MKCTQCGKHERYCKCFVTRQLTLVQRANANRSAGGTQNLQETTEYGNDTDHAIQITGATALDYSKDGLSLSAPGSNIAEIAMTSSGLVRAKITFRRQTDEIASLRTSARLELGEGPMNDNDATTKGYVDELYQSTGYGFEYINAVNGVVNIVSVGMKKVVITQNTKFDASSNPPGTFGRVIAIIDDEGGHTFDYAVNNTGDVPRSNTLARAETEFTWFRTDTGTFWQSRILKGGLVQTVVPVFAIDDYNKTLEIFSGYPDDQILLSTNNGPWEVYTGKFSFADLNRPAGFWRAKVIAGYNRLESKIQYSLPTYVGKRGFPMVLPVTLI